jgi:hypothetical protein
LHTRRVPVLDLLLKRCNFLLTTGNTLQCQLAAFARNSHAKAHFFQLSLVLSPSFSLTFHPAQLALQRLLFRFERRKSLQLLSELGQLGLISLLSSLGGLHLRTRIVELGFEVGNAALSVEQLLVLRRILGCGGLFIVEKLLLISWAVSDSTWNAKLEGCSSQQASACHLRSQSPTRQSFH